MTYCSERTTTSQSEWQHRWTYQNYPFLNKEEFAEVCHHLDSKYCKATLGPIRKQWKLRVFQSFEISFGDSEYTTILQITRPLDDTGDLDDLESQLNNFSLVKNHGQGQTADETMMEVEESDQEVLQKEPSHYSFGHVKYEIHLHPTYRAPCLWFSLHELPPDEPAFAIDTVFRRLVPDQFKDALRGVGPIGGISADVSFSSI